MQLQPFIPVPRSLLGSTKFQQQSIHAQFLLILFLGKDYGEHAKKGDIYLKRSDYEPFMCRNTYFKALEELIEAGLLRVTRTVRTVNGATRRLFTIPILASDRLEQYHGVTEHVSSVVQDGSSGSTGTVDGVVQDGSSGATTSETLQETKEKTSDETKEKTLVTKEHKDTKGGWRGAKVNSGSAESQEGQFEVLLGETTDPTPTTIPNSAAEGPKAIRITLANPDPTTRLTKTDVRNIIQRRGGPKLNWDPNDRPLLKEWADENLLPEELQAYLESRKPSGVVWDRQVQTIHFEER